MTTPQAHPGYTGLAADSTDPELIPTPRFRAAFPYADGKYAWTPAQSKRFEWISHITVTGDPAAAAYARIQDVERFDATPQQFPPFAEERIRLGHSCAIAYCSLDLVSQVVSAFEGVSEPWLLFAAWWWGRPEAPTREQVITELALAFDVVLKPDQIAACQFQPGPPFDTTIVYEPRMLHRPQGWPS